MSSGARRRFGGVFQAYVSAPRRGKKGTRFCPETTRVYPILSISLVFTLSHWPRAMWWSADPNNKNKIVSKSGTAAQPRFSPVWRRHALPGDTTRNKQSTVFGQHSCGVSGMTRRRAQVKTLLCFRLGLVFPLHLAIARLEERYKHYRGGSAVPHLVRRLVCWVS